MLPVYISYFAGDASEEGNMKKTVRNALGFILGFTLVFVALGAFAGLLGGFLRRHQLVVNIVTGAVVVVFGLNYLGAVKIPFLSRMRSVGQGTVSGFFSAVLFGIIFSVSWTPCVGAFLGSALMLASQQGSVVQGVAMLLCYSLGLGLPFFLSAILIERLKAVVQTIKKHYRVVNIVSGLFLVIIGILMMTGMMNRFLALLTF
jgi:cytochrome c-type biogenesis protein